MIKRYNIYRIDFYSNLERKIDWGIEEDDGEWCKYSDHVAELAKKDEVIAVAKEALEFYVEPPNNRRYPACQKRVAREALAKIKEMENETST